MAFLPSGKLTQTTLVLIELTLVFYRRGNLHDASEKEVRGLLLGLLCGIKHPVSVAVWDWARGTLAFVCPVRKLYLDFADFPSL
jgi:hypothetical protein